MNCLKTLFVCVRTCYKTSTHESSLYTEAFMKTKIKLGFKSRIDLYHIFLLYFGIFSTRVTLHVCMRVVHSDV